MGRAENRLKLYQYPGYEDYVAAQVEGNLRKLHNVWVRPETVKRIVLHAPATVNAILCHGTRNGAEQKLFKQHYPAATIIGTEIAGTAKDFPDTVQHDFHNQRDAWIEAFDIVYSNSFDHAAYPAVALRCWHDQLAPGGRLFLEHGVSPNDNRSTPTDPLEIAPEELQALLHKVGLNILHTFDAFGVKAASDNRSTVYVAERA